MRSRGLFGMDAPAVTVETHLPGGLPGFTLVGLPETAVREARDRVKSALQNCGFSFPAGRVVVNLAPADLVKEGARYDLAIAVSILCATKQITHSQARLYEYVGELSLHGDVRPVRGVLSALHCLQKQASNRQLVVPQANAHEVDSYSTNQKDAPRLLAINHLARLPDLLSNPDSFVAQQPSLNGKRPDDSQAHTDIDGVIGQQAAKRALVVAAAGGHHLLMVGPPGSGKTLLARCLPALLPPLTRERAMQVGAIYSAAGLAQLPKRPPFREPHHSASSTALAGGGSKGHAQPGEISLAHNGVLFLDELPHFKPSVLDLLREPMSNGYIRIARARFQAEFPARFQLLAAMNPCPAGLSCSSNRCRCTLTKVRNYQSRISGPLLDRIDIQITVPPLPANALLAPPVPAVAADAMSAREATQRVSAAQQRQLDRQGYLNAAASGAHNTSAAFGLSQAAQALIRNALERLGLSARGYHRTLRVAQTIADLEGQDVIGEQHLVEALAYRALDWGNQLGLYGA